MVDVPYMLPLEFGRLRQRMWAKGTEAYPKLGRTGAIAP